MTRLQILDFYELWLTEMEFTWQRGRPVSVSWPTYSQRLVRRSELVPHENKGVP